jgi:hypothetical protein
VLLTVHGAGHEGVPKFHHHLRQTFFIPGTHDIVHDFMCTCMTCQHKLDQLHPTGLLQPLQVSSAIWADVTMDFIKELPKVSAKSTILTMVDMFSKYVQFIPLGHPYTTTTVARVFFADIVQPHGLSCSIINDHDPTFTGNFWGELFKLSGVWLHMSMTFHPQSDGQSEAMNKIIMMYLCCLTSDDPRH